MEGIRATDVLGRTLSKFGEKAPDWGKAGFTATEQRPDSADAGAGLVLRKAYREVDRFDAGLGKTEEAATVAGWAP